MRHEALIEELTREFELDDEVSIRLFMSNYSVNEICNHEGDWNGYSVNCQSTTNWNKCELCIESWTVSELIDILYNYSIDEISSDYLHEHLTLGSLEGGSVDIDQVSWINQPPLDEDLQDFDKQELYDLHINDSEIKFDPGSIERLEISLRKSDRLVIHANGDYYFELAPRIKWWSIEDKSLFEQQYSSALKELKQLQFKYNLLLQSGVDENLPDVSSGETDNSLVFGNSKCSCCITSEVDWRDKKVIEMQFLTEHGSIFSFQFDSFTELIKLRNLLILQVDKFGRESSDQIEIEQTWFEQSSNS